MTDSESNPKPPRRYPDFWEKSVPIFLAIIGVAVFVLLVIIFGVATGLIGSY